jgi:uncharacterized protein
LLFININLLKMEVIYEKHIQYLRELTEDFVRDFFAEIDWNDRLIFIRGARGCGKTTMMLQYIKRQFGNSEKVLYISMDDFIINGYSLLDIASYHYNHGGTHLFIDEIHKYYNWSQELKNISDTYKKLNVVVSGSSILQIQKGDADLSRRAVTYDMKGLSLREFINIQSKLELKPYSLNDILAHHLDICTEINSKVNSLQYFNDYLKYGYYPYFLESTLSYHKKLSSTINLSIELDLPQLLNVEVGNIVKIKKLIYLLSINVPYQPNLSKLALSLDLNRQTVTTYLHYLHEANVLQILWNEGKMYTPLSKPDKIYLQNANLFYIFDPNTIEKGALRETFFFNQLSYHHQVTLPSSGDFLVNKKYLFEIGGMKKSYSQIANIKNCYIAADDILIGSKNKIPLWLFGHMY